ncbi:MAG: hypothetical protein ABR924_02015 [Terracidiphilus sp.]
MNYWLNFEAPALKLRRLFERGALGSLVHAESYYGYDLDGEYGKALKLNPWALGASPSGKVAL